MVSNEKLTVFVRLQQIILDTPNNSELLDKILPEMLVTLSSVKLTYEFISALFISTDFQVQKAFFVDVHSLKTNDKSSQLVINFNELFKEGSQNTSDLKQGKILISENMKDFIYETYFDYSHLKTLVISPIRVSNLLTGLLIFATIRQKSEILDEEIYLIEIVSNLISLVYRVQDTQTSLIKITREVYQKNAQLHQLDKLKDDFVTITSHELRTPMTAIRSYAWMALNRSDMPLSEKLKKYLSRTLISTERLINLVNDMLNISRIEAGRVEIIPTAFDIQNLIREVKNEVDARDLIGNSLKFTPHGGTVSISFFADGQMLDVTISDNGVGIAQDDLPRLFKKFGRLDNSYVAAATSGGTGLGLYICKSLVEMMKGKIWVRSDGVGRGSVFSFSLPIATDEIVNHSDQFTTKVEGESKMLEPVAI
ncbi:HAMP domain-containing histidine kinase [Candidatus Daviesbacteria bacterium]|nr:HAMP domain-containing histidine kinase [Candidatus Daviesbacteria bacterium]